MDTKRTVPVPDRVLDRQLRELDATFQGFGRMMARSMAPLASDVELSPKDGRALMTVAHKGRVTMTDLAEQLGVPLSTATRMVERLIEKGLAVRSRIEDDRRVVFVELSDEGRRLHEAYEGQRRAMGREMLAPLSHGEREIFIELMKKIAAPRPDAQ
jgi:DNA-binding MarR family transcriptional regulator